MSARAAAPQTRVAPEQLDAALTTDGPAHSVPDSHPPEGAYGRPLSKKLEDLLKALRDQDGLVLRGIKREQGPHASAALAYAWKLARFAPRQLSASETGRQSALGGLCSKILPSELQGDTARSPMAVLTDLGTGLLQAIRPRIAFDMRASSK